MKVDHDGLAFRGKRFSDTLRLDPTDASAESDTTSDAMATGMLLASRIIQFTLKESEA